MPRDGSGVYTRPPGTDAVADTTIDSAKYNNNVADVEADLNTPRPIVAGGTAATSADNALTSLSAEKAKQIVTNWDSTTWRAGSFYAATSATGAAPVAGHAFAGLAYYANTTDFVSEAIDLTDPANPAKYVRVMTAGVWGAWSSIGVNVVRYDVAQALTQPQLIQARQNIYAAPFDALAFNGLQVNGSMDVSQENGATAVAVPAGTFKYPADTWATYYVAATAVFQTAQFAAGLPGLPNGIYLRSTTGAPFSGASEFVTIQSAIEGYRISRLGWGAAGARPITIAFWVLATVAGTFALTVQNGLADRSYTADVTIITAGAWEYKTVTIPGCTTGTWDIGNGVGLYLEFNFAAGSSLRSTANTWLTGNFRATVATTNFFAVNNNQVALTGLVILPGSEAPSQAQHPLIMRPYDRELALCKRYLHRLTFTAAASLGINQTYSTTLAGGCAIYFPVEMRAAPTVTFSAASHFSGGAPGGGGSVCSTLVIGASTSSLASVGTSTFATGLAAGGGASSFGSTTASAWLQMNARL